MEPTLMVLLMTAAVTSGVGAQAYTEAFAKQSRLDIMLDEYQRRLIRDEQTRELVGNVGLLTKIAVERRVTWHISFP